MFVDRVEITVQAGRGGNGCLSFRRERFVPRGGPDGGDGGDGGSVVLEVDPQLSTLAPLAHRSLWRAENGRPGQGANRHGRKGRDLVIPVPPGTVVRDAQRGFVIKDLTAPGQRLVVARGGRGGRGNAHFKSSTNRAPRETTPGEPGQQRRLLLELKLIADVGLLGMPNAGKSTLLSRMSRARPKIADYPFTTKEPHLGQVHVEGDRYFVMADIPGLIEGAHAGHGLGHDFLRHVQRTRVLVHLVEPTPMDGSDPEENYHKIRRELELFDPQLALRPEVVAVTKADLPEAAQVQKRLAARLPEKQVLLISAVTGQGLRELKWAVVEQLDRLDREPPVQPTPAESQPRTG